MYFSTLLCILFVLVSPTICNGSPYDESLKEKGNLNENHNANPMSNVVGTHIILIGLWLIVVISFFLWFLDVNFGCNKIIDTNDKSSLEINENKLRQNTYGSINIDNTTTEYV